MLDRHRIICSLPVLAFVALAIAACSKPSSEPAASDQSRAEAPTGDVTLRPADIDLFIDSTEKLKAYADAHPDFDSDQIGGNNEETPEQFAARVEATPALKAAFDSTGVPPAAFDRAGSMITGAMFGAAMAQGQDRKTLPQPVQYYLAHKADIDRRFKAIAEGSAE